MPGTHYTNQCSYSTSGVVGRAKAHPLARLFRLSPDYESYGFKPVRDVRCLCPLPRGEGQGEGQTGSSSSLRLRLSALARRHPLELGASLVIGIWGLEFGLHTLHRSLKPSRISGTLCLDTA